jgi:hypothetical protein
MAKQIVINIPVPCNEDWGKMSSNSCGAYCQSCRKNVIDFSSMTENEIYNIVTTATQPLCGRFNTLQIGQPIRKTELRSSGFSLKAMAAALAGFIATTKLYAAGDLESKPKTEIMQKAISDTASWPAPLVKKDSIQTNTEKKLIITAKVVDERSNQPIQNAAIHYGDSKEEFHTDEKGIFKMEIPEDSAKQWAAVTVSAGGYQYVMLKLRDIDQKNMKVIKMHEAEIMMGMMYF